MPGFGRILGTREEYTVETILARNGRRVVDEDQAVSCTVDASCGEGFHSFSWPCDYAPGTGRFATATDEAGAR